LISLHRISWRRLHMLIHTDRTARSLRRTWVLGLLALVIASCGGGSSGGGAPPLSAPSDLSYASPVVLTVDVQAPTISPTVTGSVSTYSISPALPEGLSLSASTGKITGMPVAESAAGSYVVTAENTAGSTTFTLSLAVLIPAPSALSYLSPDSYQIGAAITALSPSVTGLVTRYAVAPALPAGLSLDAVTGQITGAPTTATASASYVITASNGSGSTNFSLTLSVLIPPPSALSYASPQIWISGTPIAAISPSVTGTVTQYSVMPALPAGILLNPGTGLISGTPTAAVALSNYLVTASNSSGATNFTLTITVLVPPPSGLSYPSPQIFTAGTAIAPLSPTVTGIATYYYSQPALPAGLSLDPVSGRITGTPTAATPAASYLITAGNGTGSTTFSLAIVVRVAAPSGLSYHSPKTYYVGTAIIPLSPVVTGTVASYGVAPALPPGLTLNPITGVIFGTPTAARAAASYTITASNSTGSTNCTLSITVVLLPPKSLSYPSPQTYAVGSAITPLNPFVVGVVASSSVSPALPAGLSLDSISGQLTGTPTTLTAAATYTVMAANAAGSTTFALVIAVATVGVTPAQISRLVAAGTPVVIQLTVQSQSLTGPLYVIASDPSSLFNSAVNVTGVANGYAVALTVSTVIAAGHYTGNVLLTLCQDSSCTMPQTPASITVPFNVQLLSPTSAWPGNNAGALAAWSGVADWTMFQGNAAHTGYVPAAVDPNTFTTRWQGGPTLSNTSNYDNGAFAYTLTTDAGQLYIAVGTTLYALKELDASQV
jgi:hypothetical protein